MVSEKDRRPLTEQEAKDLLIYLQQERTEAALVRILARYFVCLPVTYTRTLLEGEGKGSDIAWVGEDGYTYSTITLQELNAFIKRKG